MEDMTETRGIRSKRPTGQKSHTAIKRGSHAGRVPASTANCFSMPESGLLEFLFGGSWFKPLSVYDFSCT